ncbi:MAG: hypothetical protein PHY99_08465, partial [Bacteroidales bacterium]|nr:hypothetical protein [Bacteroidales bacterium]
MKILLSVFFCLIGVQAYSQKMPAGVLVNRIDSVYAHAVTYQDHGEVENYRKFLGVNRKIVRPFQTVYRRDAFFRFSCFTKRQMHSFHGFQWDSTGIINGCTDGKAWARKGNGYSVYVDSFNAYSRGSSVIVPLLLMPSNFHGKHILRDHGQVSITRMESIGGQNCFVQI